MKTIVVVVCLTAALLYVIFAARSKKPFKNILFTAAVGACSCVFMHILSDFSGLRFPLNSYRMCFCSVFGLPGTIGLLLSDMLFYM